jgi:site-specific DNA recombinase
MLLRNRLYVGAIDVPDFGVRDQRGDFEPLISEEIFYKAQAVLSGKVPVIAPLLKHRPDFPLRGFVRCAVCDRGLTGSWSKGRMHYYAYYHCRPGCRGLNVTKAKLEGLFVDELARWPFT